jgi:hypothetical protein
MCIIHTRDPATILVDLTYEICLFDLSEFVPVRHDSRLHFWNSRNVPLSWIRLQHLTYPKFIRCSGIRIENMILFDLRFLIDGITKLF